MADFARVKPAGWGTNVLLASAEMNQLDIDHAKAPNAVDGGGPYPGDITWSGKHIRSGSGAGERLRIGSFGDANATCDTSKDVYIASATPSVARTITLRSTTAPLPQDGEVIYFVCTQTSGAADWIFQREGGTELGRLKTVAGGRSSIAFIWTASGTPRWMGFLSSVDGTFTNHS